MHFPFTKGALGSFRNRTTLEKKIIQTAKPKKIQSKPKTAYKTVKFDIFHILVIKILINAIQWWQGSIQRLFEISGGRSDWRETRETGTHIGKNLKPYQIPNPSVFLTKIRKPKAKKRKIRKPQWTPKPQNRSKKYSENRNTKNPNVSVLYT